METYENRVIPFKEYLIYGIMLFVPVFGFILSIKYSKSEQNENKRNFAKAMIVIHTIFTILIGTFLILLFLGMVSEPVPVCPDASVYMIYINDYIFT